ncbi:MAG: peptidoglycan-binding domain-containing protein [Hyphomicrobiaceae bacterium]
MSSWARGCAHVWGEAALPVRSALILSSALLGFALADPAAAAAPHFGRPAGETLVRPVAVFGQDDRVALPERLATTASRIGVLFNNPARSVCSAFCVGPAMIATAAHCVALTSPQGSRMRPADFLFARAYDRERDYARIEGYSTGSAAQHILTGEFRLNVRPPIDAARDWALVRLDRSICRNGGLAIQPTTSADILAIAQAGRLFNIAYHRDLPTWTPTYSGPCYAGRDFGASEWSTIAPDFESPDQIILHTCDTGGASSGSPVLAEGPRGPVVVAVNVGTYIQSRVVTQQGQVTQRQQTETIANTAVNATVFAEHVATFRAAQILATGAPIRQLQEHLAAFNFYSGRADGDYGPVLKAAIVDYQKAQGVPATGLPTAELLSRLMAQVATRHTPTSAPLPDASQIPAPTPVRPRAPESLPQPR